MIEQFDILQINILISNKQDFWHNVPQRTKGANKDKKQVNTYTMIHHHISAPAKLVYLFIVIDFIFC